MALRKSELELKQAGLREKRLIDELAALKIDRLRSDEEVTQLKETCVLAKTQSDNMSDLLKVLAETEEVLKRKVSLFMS